MPAEHGVFSRKSFTRPSCMTMILMSWPPTSTIDVRVVVDVQRGVGVRHRLDQRGVAREHVFQDVLGVAGRDEPERRPRARPAPRPAAERAEDLDGVLDRVAARELVGLGQHAAVLVEQHGLGGGRSGVEADEAPDLAAGSSVGGTHAGRSYSFRNSARSIPESPTAAAPRRFSCARGDGSASRAGAPVGLDRLALAAPNSTPPSAPKYSAIGGATIRSSVVAPSGSAIPRSRQRSGMCACQASRSARMKGVRPADEQHARRQGVPRESTIRFCRTMASKSEAISSSAGDARLLEAVDVGLGEHAALAGDRVHLEADVGECAERLGRDLELGGDLVDDHAGAAGALVVHRHRLARRPRSLPRRR